MASASFRCRTSRSASIIVLARFRAILEPLSGVRREEDPTEGEPMEGAGAGSTKRATMIRGSVPFVACEAIGRIERVELLHHLVAEHLGQNGCGGNRQAPSISVHQRA